MWYSPYSSPTDWAYAKAKNVAALKTILDNGAHNKGCLKIYAKYVLVSSENDITAFKDTLKLISQDYYSTYALNLLQVFSDVLSDMERDIINCAYSPVSSSSAVDITVSGVPCEDAWKVVHGTAAMVIRILSFFYPQYMTVARSTLSRYQQMINSELFDTYAVAFMIAARLYAVCEISDDSLEYAKNCLEEALKATHQKVSISVPNTTEPTTSQFQQFVLAVVDFNRPAFFVEPPAYKNDVGHEILKNIVSSEDVWESANKFAKLSKCTPECAENVISSMELFADDFNDSIKEDSEVDTKAVVESVFGGYFDSTQKDSFTKAVRLASDYVNANTDKNIAPEAVKAVCEAIDAYEVPRMQNNANSDLYDSIAYLEYLHEVASREDGDQIATEARKAPKKNPEMDEVEPVHGKAKVGKFSDKMIGVSEKFKKGTTKVYSDWRKYKSQEQKIDSQVSKVVTNATKTVLGTDDNTARRRVVGDENISIISILKRLLGTYAIFSYSKIGAICLLVVRHALRKGSTENERQKILTELQNEIEMCEEKIQDARSSDDPGSKQAKYQLMRTKQNLENAYKKIKYHSNKSMTLGGLKQATNTIKQAREES